MCLRFERAAYSATALRLLLCPHCDLELALACIMPQFPLQPYS